MNMLIWILLVAYVWKVRFYFKSRGSYELTQATCYVLLSTFGLALLLEIHVVIITGMDQLVVNYVKSIEGVKIALFRDRK